MSKVPKAGVDLHGYLTWRRSLVALDVGTIIRFNVPYAALTICENIKPGQHFKIINVEKSLNRFHEDIPASNVYVMQLCTRNGKLFKHLKYWSVEGIARYITDDEITVI